MIVDPVTARYAGALYGLARRKSALDAVSKDVAALAAEVARPATRSVLFNPRVEREAKRQQLAPVLAGANVLTRNFVNLLLDKDRESVLKSLAAAWKRLSLDERGAVEGRVESARPLDPADVSRLAAKLSAQLGRTLTLENKVVPELLGGARVFAANRMIDWSVQGRLESLRRKLLEARLPSASPS
ncbi:MAG: ATP synthase F1 subunit delta [Planctomycetota bacterium]